MATLPQVDEYIPELEDPDDRAMAEAQYQAAAEAEYASDGDGMANEDFEGPSEQVDEVYWLTH